MATEIQLWEIKDGKLVQSETSMAETGRTEFEDLERWIKNSPEILGDDILIIGEQIQTKSGPLDFLGIDKSGNMVIIELKRDRLPREALAQAIDYASDISSWDIERLNQECSKYSGQPLEDYITENFEDVDWEDISINQFQKILLVGTSVDEALQRMIEWLSDIYSVSINALVFKYTKTSNGDEVIAKTTIIPEEVEKEKSQRHQRKIYAERHILRKEFWTELLEKAKQKIDLFNNISPSIYSWIGRGAGKSGISYNFLISNKYARCEIYFDAGKDSESLNKQRFEELLRQKEEIERKFGANLNWERLEDRRASRISFSFPEGSLRNKEGWDAVQTKMVDGMIRLVEATKEFIIKLD